MKQILAKWLIMKIYKITKMKNKQYEKGFINSVLAFLFER